MTNDNILDRIDAVLGHEETVIDDDWSVSSDAMRSRPPSEHDTPYEPTIGPRFAHSDTTAPCRGCGQVKPINVMCMSVTCIARAFDVPPSMIDPLLDVPRPSLRLQVINALGLMPILTRLVKATAQLVDRAHHLSEQIDPRRAARDRRAGRTIIVTLRADTTEFNRSMLEAGDRLRVLGASMGVSAYRAGAGLQLFGSAIRAAADYERLERQVAAYSRIIARSEMRAIADVARLEARLWLDQHVATIYADLGLVRPQED